MIFQGYLHLQWKILIDYATRPIIWEKKKKLFLNKNVEDVRPTIIDPLEGETASPSLAYPG